MNGQARNWFMLCITSMALSLPYAAIAQDPNATLSGPVDIQAKQQVFSGDQVLAKGNVKVSYKDTIITGPEVALTRNTSGSPQSAVFKGHPYFVQNGSIMDSDVLMF